MNLPADTVGSPPPSPRVSVIIKALNEENKIGRAIESALLAVRRVEGGGEVILADSLSTDRTVEIASGYPIRILQLLDARDRSCGVGAQFGAAAARGEFLYILDGDMELNADFLPVAIARLLADPHLAGVAGLVEEMCIANEAFKRRAMLSETQRPAEKADCLNMGGLYRREAVQQLGYLTNRNLHAFEEFELGARLVRAGWRLERLGLPAVRHYGHVDASYALLVRRWRSRYAWGHGELLRQAWGAPHLGLVLWHLGVYRVSALVLAIWALPLLFILSGRLSLPASILLAPAIWVGVTAITALRKRSLRSAVFAVASWHIGLAGLIRGLMATPRGAPDAPVPHRVVL